MRIGRMEWLGLLLVIIVVCIAVAGGPQEVFGTDGTGKIYATGGPGAGDLVIWFVVGVVILVAIIVAIGKILGGREA